MYYWFINSLSWVFPCFNISDDDNFGTLKKDSKQRRFSLLAIRLGGLIFYFCSYGYWRGQPEQINLHSKGFKLFYSLRLSKYGNLSDSEIERLKTNHATFLNAHPETDKRIVYKETLMYKLDELKEKKNKSFNKLLAYLAVFAFLIPLLIPPVLNFKDIFDKPLFMMLSYLTLSLYLVYFLINFATLFFESVKVKTYSRFSYRSIKESTVPEETFLNGLYIEYQLRNNESTNEVSFILNIEKYIRASLIASVLLISIHILFTFSEINPKNIGISDKSAQVLHLKLDESPRTLLNNQKDELQTIEDDLLKNRIKRILLIRSGTSSIENYIRIVNLIQSYNVNSIEIVEIIDKPHPLSQEGHLQIVIERR
ncbi:hypothetical protein J2T13_002124 [Paenibacillus sp. DS2015]|uniref:hypothetical protein n=1 Tax=Paenibacillus sp. DS2015 TaxID=3373917 RepID=UPI003D231B82